LHEAYRTGRETSADSLKTLSIDEGYAVQRAFISARNDEEGPVVGYKLGFTNEQIQRETGVSEPVYGHLLQDTVDVEAVRLADLVDPRAEPEIMIRLGESLSATNSREEVADVVESVTPVIEVVDSRTGSWNLAPGTAIADNALAACLVTGPECQLSECPPLADVEVTVSTDEMKQTGRGEAVLGDPLEAVAWLSRTLDRLLPNTVKQPYL
jgi:2-keto-4-pentenoate hydratase